VAIIFFEFFKLHLFSGLRDGEVFAVGADSSVEGVAVVFGVGKDMKCGTLPSFPGILDLQTIESTQSAEWQAFLGNLPSENQEWHNSVGALGLQAFDDNDEAQFNDQYKEFVDQAYGRNHQLESFYLLLLGVRPSSQGKGLGTELLRGVQAKVNWGPSLQLLTET
jgi:ribosomal protein S18 acetylase RimI-like enzyme